MMRYSVQNTDQVFVKDYGFLSFAKNMGKNIGKNISKILSGKYSLKPLDHAKKSATDGLKTSSKRIIQKGAEGTSDLNGNEVVNKITKVSKNSQENNSERVTNENDKEISKDRYISSEERPKILDNLIFNIIA